MDAVANLAVDVLNQKEILPTMADIRETLSNNYQPTISSSYDEGNSSSNSSSESNEEKGGKQGGYDKKDDDDKKSSKKRKRAPKTTPETTEARRESHKIIEQKRRQKINEKINELRELLNYPDGTQNKAVVLQAAVDNIRNLKVLCAKLLASHRQLQEDYVQVVHENERLKKIIPPTLRPPGTTPPMASPISNFPSTISKPQNVNAAPNQPQPSAQNPSLFNELRSSGPNQPDWTFVYDENQNPSSNNQLIQQYQQAMAQRGGNPSLFQSQQPPNIPIPNPSQMQNLSQPQFGLFSSSAGGNPNLGYNSIEALARTLFTDGNLPLPISNQMPSSSQPQTQQPGTVGGPEGNMQPSDQFESH